MQDQDFQSFGAPAPLAASPAAAAVTAPAKENVSPRHLSYRDLFLTMSFETDKLFDALAKAQGEIEVALKDSENPHFKSSYADLASVWRACRAALSKQGISITQWPIPATKPGLIAMLTRATLGSQWAMSGVEIPIAAPGGVQQIGSGYTYLRRYMLAAIAGVAPDDDQADAGDDDGNAAQGIKPKPPKTPQAAPSAKPPASTPAQQHKPSQTAPQAPASPPAADLTPPTEKQLARLFTIATTGPGAWTKEQLKEYIGLAWKIDSTKKLTRAQYDHLVGLVETLPFTQACARILSAPKA